MDYRVYDCSLNITIDKTKFQQLDKDSRLTRKSKLQRFPRKLKSKGSLNKTTYRDIYGS